MYVDVSGWHLYLRDVSVAPGGPKMAEALANKLGTVRTSAYEDTRCSTKTQEVADIGYSEAMVKQVLALVPVSLGKGKVEVPLLDIIPDHSLQDLCRAVEDHARSRRR